LHTLHLLFILDKNHVHFSNFTLQENHRVLSQNRILTTNKSGSAGTTARTEAAYNLESIS